MYDTDLVINANFILNYSFLWTTTNKISLNIDNIFFIFIST